MLSLYFSPIQCYTFKDMLCFPRALSQQKQFQFCEEVGQRVGKAAALVIYTQTVT